MSAKSGLIWALVNSVIIAASISSVRGVTQTNIYFKKCHEKYSMAEQNCKQMIGYGFNRCIHGGNLQFYCLSSSPITVNIGRYPDRENLDTSFPETLNITSTSTQRYENSHDYLIDYSMDRIKYCIEIAGRTSEDYFLTCRDPTTNWYEWFPFNEINDRQIGVYNFYPKRLQYENVEQTDPIEFCDSLGPVLLEQVPLLLPCKTWHACAAVLANRYKNRSLRKVGLVNLSTIDYITSRCTSVWKLVNTLRPLREHYFSKPGLLAFRHHDHNSEFLLPYNPPGNQDDLYVEAFAEFTMKITYRVLETVRIVCQSSVLHSCGFDIVTKNLRIKHSHVDCLRHTTTIETIQGLNGSITCSTFDEFRDTWVSKTEFFDNSSSKSPIYYETTENPSLAGNNTNVSNGNETTDTSNYAVNNENLSYEKKTFENPSLAGNNTTNVSNGNETTDTSSYAVTSDENVYNEKKTTETPSHAGNENSTNLPPVEDPEDSGSISLVLIIVGTLLGGVFLCFLVLLPLLIYLYKRIKLQRRRIRLTEEECLEFIDGMKMEKAESTGIHDIFVLPYDRSLEVSKTAVDFQTTILGSGAFGQVLKGKYKGQDVAIKTIDSSTMNAESFRSLLKELKIMSYLGTHEHVMELVGAITSKIKQGEVYLILEYCAHGSAVNYVQGHRDAFVSFLSDDQTAYTQTCRDEFTSKLSSQHLVRWSYEVACGMEYVSSLKIYHGDLAARNILITENLTVKIGDFGLSRQLDMENYTCYVQKGDCPLPLKWMAIESIRDLKFSIQSDVWSFGVTIWEFFSLGKIPYQGKKWNWESWKVLCEGERLERPEFASFPIYENIMRKCWEEDPKDRPTFAALKFLLHVEMEAFN